MKIFAAITLVIAGLILVKPLQIQAQVDPPVRLELESRSVNEKYVVIPCSDYGLIIMNETDMTNDSSDIWRLSFYDRWLTGLKEINVGIGRGFEYLRFIYTPDSNFIYAVFGQEEKKGERDPNFQMIRISLRDMNFVSVSSIMPSKYTLSELNATQEGLFAGVSTEKETSLYRIDVQSRQSKLLYKTRTHYSELETLYQDTLNKRLISIFNIYDGRDNYYLLVKHYDPQGNSLDSLEIHTEEQNAKINTAKMIRPSNGDYIIAGTYSNTEKAGNAKNYFNDESSGFYTILIRDNVVQDYNFYNFLQFDNFTGYLKSSEVLSMKKKMVKKNREAEKMSLDYEMLVHDIIRKDGHFYFVAEAYYPEYHTVTTYYYDYYGRAMPVSYNVFDGYRYFNAFITCFDSLGEKVWDNGMEIYNILNMRLDRLVNVWLIDSSYHTVIAYNHNGKIVSKVIDGDEVVEGISNFSIEPSYINDRIMSDDNSSMQHWYDKYFVCYGFQTIQNNSLANQNKRTVFYINKIGFD